MCIIFEQTKQGNIHYHIIMHTLLHKHDVRAILAELFNFKKATSIILNINVKNVTNLTKLFDYFFNKNEKNYESLDMNKFKPIILI